MGPFPLLRVIGHAPAWPRRFVAGLALASLATAYGPLAARVGAAFEGFKVITHPTVAGQKIRRSDLAAVYMKTVNRWADGRSALPVDQPASAEVRKRFSEGVLRLNVVLASQYWLKQMTAGGSGIRRVPPLVKSTDEEVLAYVKANPGAVGYVSPGFALGDEVKVVEIVE
jgi:ABC-type phosphate transport system substrate-binding protein